jgi:hypothetical protein
LRPYLNYSYTAKAENHDDIEGTFKKHFGDDGKSSELIILISHDHKQKRVHQSCEARRLFFQTTRKEDWFFHKTNTKERIIASWKIQINREKK